MCDTHVRTTAPNQYFKLPRTNVRFHFPFCFSCCWVRVVISGCEGLIFQSLQRPSDGTFSQSVPTPRKLPSDVRLGKEPALVASASREAARLDTPLQGIPASSTSSHDAPSNFLVPSHRTFYSDNPKDRLTF